MYRGEQKPTVYDKILNNDAVKWGLLGLSFGVPFGKMAGAGIRAAIKGLGHNTAKYGMSRWSGNVPNLLEGFYSGKRGAKATAMGKGMMEGAKNTLKQATSLSASKANRYGGVSKITHDINENNIKAIHSIIKDPKNWDFRLGKYGKLKKTL